MSDREPPGLLLDEHVPVSVARALRERGVDATHVLEEALGGTTDPDLIRWCQEHGQILVTRNYQDFAPLVEMLTRRTEPFPGVLFLPSSRPHSHVGAHVHALEKWLKRREGGDADVLGTFGWVG